jgi:hypothetical protein
MAVVRSAQYRQSAPIPISGGKFEIIKKGETNMTKRKILPTHVSGQKRAANFISDSAKSLPEEQNWDLSTLRLPQNFDDIIMAQPVIANVTVRKPHSQEWFRVHPREDYRLQTAIINLKSESESYLVHPTLLIPLWEEIQPVVLFFVVNRQQEFFIWPVRLPKGDVRPDNYIQTDMAAAKAAETNWTRRAWVPQTRSHKISTTKKWNENPIWPEVSFQQLIDIAFKDRRIGDLEHSVVKGLRGES